MPYLLLHTAIITVRQLFFYYNTTVFHSFYYLYHCQYFFQFVAINYCVAQFSSPSKLSLI